MTRWKWRGRQLLTAALALAVVEIGNRAVSALFDTGAPQIMAALDGRWSDFSLAGGAQTLLAMAGVAGAAVLLLLVVEMSKDAFFQLSVRLRADDNALAEVLVMGVSPPLYRPDPAREAEARQALATLGARRAGAPSAEIKAQATSDPALGQLTQHNWTPALRVVRKHLSRLRHVVLIPSPQSFAAAADLKALIEQAARQDGRELEVEIPFARPDECPSNDDYNALQAAFRRRLRRLRDRYGDLRHVCIDATAGTKMLSVAAATATINENALFCYADTNSGAVAIWEAKATHEPAVSLPM